MHFGVGLLVAAAVTVSAQAIDPHVERPRLFVLTDMGNEPDDQMSFVRLLVYSNQLDIEGLAATTSTWQRTATHPETMQSIVDAYGQVRSNLLKHADGWPEAEKLRAMIVAGQPGYGMAATGAGKSTDGSRALIRAAERDDPRPLWVSVWGGANTLAQALFDARASKSAEEMKRLTGKLRVYSISDQDDAGPWIRREFPEIQYVGLPSPPSSEEYYYATWTGIAGDVYYRNCAGADSKLVTNEWLEANVRAKGPLGKHYPKFMFIMEGDTPAYLGLLGNGLNSYQRPDWGGWGGRYILRTPRFETRPVWTQGGDTFGRVTSSQDTVRGMDGREVTTDQATVWRWREAFQHDFAARMDWTIADFKGANHNPVLVVNNSKGTAPVLVDAVAGKPVRLDAGESRDPDGNKLRYRWFHYAEAGAGMAGVIPADVTLAGADTEMVTVTPVSPCRAAWLPGRRQCNGPGTAHIILEVTDDGVPKLTSYRRVILTVR